MDPTDADDGENKLSIAVGRGVSRRRMMKQLSVAGAAVGLAGCQDVVSVGDDGDQTNNGVNQDSNEDGSNTSGGAPNEFNVSRHPLVEPPQWDPSKTEQGAADTERTCVFVIQNVANPFFVPLTVGFHDAVHQFGWKGELTGPTERSVSEQVNVLNTVIDDLSAGDVLITTVLDEAAYIEPIQRAMNNDIAVVNGHSTPPAREWDYATQKERFDYKGRDMIVPHVGVRDSQGGAAMADEAYNRLQEKFPDKDEYVVLLTNELPDNPAVTRRVNHPTSGANTYFESKDDVVIHDLINPEPSISDARSELVTVLTGNEDIDAVVGSAFWSPVGISNAIDDGQINRDLVICGFDFVNPLLVGISNGNVDFTVGQDPYGQGFMSVPPAWMWLERGIEMKDIEFGVSLVDERNVDYVLERRSWSKLLDWQENNYSNIQ